MLRANLLHCYSTFIDSFSFAEIMFSFLCLCLWTNTTSSRRTDITIKYAIEVIHQSIINYALLSLVLLFAVKHKEN